MNDEELKDPMHAQVDAQFVYHAPNLAQVDSMNRLREKGKELAHLMIHHCPPSADRSAAIRHLREALMTANASIILEGKTA